MLLFTFTTSGGSREDGNVFYASQVLVDAPETDRSKITAVVTTYLENLSGTKAKSYSSGRNISIESPPYPENGTEEEELVWEEASENLSDAIQDTKQIIAKLTQLGWKAEEMDATFIVHDRGM